MEHINKADQIEEVRIRTILDEKIEEKLPLNYDVVQELAEKAQELNSCLFVAHCGWYKGGKSKYVEYLTFREVLQQFYICINTDLVYREDIVEFTATFLAYRLLFNSICNDNTKLHVEVLNECNDPAKAWELFYYIQNIINNFETEILLSDTEDTENV